MLPSSEQACDLRNVLFHFLADRLCPPEEDAGVPQKLTGGKEYLCELPVRFFREGLYLHRGVLAKRFSSSDHLGVTVVGVRAGRNDSESEEHIVLLDVIECAADGLHEKVFVLDDVVRRHYDKLRVRISFEKGICGIYGAGCRISCVWFQQQIVAFQLRNLLHYKVAVLFGGDYKDVLLRKNLETPVVCVPYECLSRLRNIKKLFWFCHPADRPESCSGSSGHDDAIAIILVHWLYVLFFRSVLQMSRLRST